MDIVSSELLAPPLAQERRRLDRSLCAELLDPLLRRLARQEALCRRVLGRLARVFLHRRAHQHLGFVRIDDYARERLGMSGRDHHVLYRSRGGENTRDNRVAICAAHHLNGIHRFRIRVAGVAPHDLTWEIGFRQGRPPLLRTHGDRYLDA